jgi:NitT/TauT family transport system substrate-binding protein
MNGFGIRRLVWVLILAGIAAGAGAQNVHLAIGYIPHIQFAPLYVGMEKGFYREDGLDLTIEYGFGIDIFSLLAAGKIDLGLSDSDQLIVAGAKGLPLKAVYQYYQRYPVSVVALRNRYATPQSLAGRTIERYGLEDSVKVERIGYTQLVSLQSAKVDAVVVFANNEPVQLRSAGADIVEWKVSDFSNMVGASFISSEDTIQAKTDLLRRFAHATRRAMEYASANRAEAIELSRKYLGPTLVDETMRAVLDATSDLFVSPEGWGHLDEAAYSQAIATLRRLGMIDTVYPAARILKPLDD